MTNPSAQPSDEELMRRAQGGDKQAFETLYERYHSAVIAYLNRMLGDVEELESVVQEVFLRAFKFAATYRYPQEFSTWLFTIARNVAINRGGPMQPPPVENVTEIIRLAIDDPEKQADLARVLTALDQLPTEQKEVIVLGIFQDMSYAAMEKFTGTPAETLRARMFEGLRALAKLLRREGDAGDHN